MANPSLLLIYALRRTIRLSIYAQGLNIRTMQLIGATEQFIRKPFLWSGMIQGFLAGILAISLLIRLILMINFRLASIDPNGKFLLKWEFVALLTGIVLFGGVFGYLASYFIVNRYLNKSLDEITR